MRGKRVFLHVLSVVVALLPLQKIHSETSNPVLWLEAESFEQVGGWSNDPQFVDVMGSPYLIATGVGQPVEDAVTHLDVVTAGSYRLWVRSKDWLPQHSPGQYRVLVNGQASEAVFGKAHDDRWRWVDAGSFSLEAGSVEIRLNDMTGWWGRCDAIVLSRDPDFRPANDVHILEKQRAEYCEPYRNLKRQQPHDVVVVGGGLAGSAAAIAAARDGCSVLLIQDRPVLGGNASSEIDVAPGGDSSNEPLDPSETGIIEEFYPRTDRGFDHDWSSAIERVVNNEPRLDLRLNTRAINVAMKDLATIHGVVAMDVRSGERMLFPGKIFVDGTGDGWVGFWAGAEFRKGRESRSEFGESLAPEKADSFTMGNTLMVASFREEDVPFHAPEWAYRWESPSDFDPSGLHFGLEQVQFPIRQPNQGAAFRFTHGSGIVGLQHSTGEDAEQGEKLTHRPMPVTPPHYQPLEKGKGYRPRSADGGFFQWWVEFGGRLDTIYDAEQIRDELFRVNLGLWNYVKNYAPEFKEANSNRRLVWINYVPGKRESRRFVGDYILTQWDYADRVLHEDNVAYGGWGVDVHHPNGFWKNGPMYYSAYRGHKVSIPFRCLYSKNISNLLMAGRHVSVSHVALGGVRVMRTTCLMGQAAGNAAALCARENVLPRTAGEKYIREIQQRLLKDGAYVMGRKNTDPADLALKATATASSVKVIPDPQRAQVAARTPLVHDLNMQRAVMFKAESDRIDRIELYLRSTNETVTPVTIALRKAKAFGDFSGENDIVTATTAIPPRSKGWITFNLCSEADPGDYYYVSVPPAKGLQWDLYPVLVKDTCRAYGGPGWTLREECYKFRSWPGGQPSVPDAPTISLSPENVIDGYSRSVNGSPHSWSPDPAAPLPQWVELAFASARSFNTIHVTFQNRPLLCRKYSLEVCDEGKWRTVVTAEQNDSRRIVHTFDRVVADRLRLVLRSPSRDNEVDTAQVCEIRVYDETR